MHIIAPVEELEKKPLANAVGLVSLRDAAKGKALPESAARMAVTVDGTESEEEVAALKVRAIV